MKLAGRFAAGRRSNEEKSFAQHEEAARFGETGTRWSGASPRMSHP
jgi:hypothetical protein